jgi:hypothetical protein
VDPRVRAPADTVNQREEHAVARAYASTVIDAPAEAVWSRIRDFNGLPSWHPVVADSMIEDGRPGDAVGGIRKITTRTGNGQTLREKLPSLSDHDRSVSFDFQTAPFPVCNYCSKLRVMPVTDGGRSFVEWWATFDCDAAQEAEMVRTFVQGVYQPGFQALKQHFAG